MELLHDSGPQGRATIADEGGLPEPVVERDGLACNEPPRRRLVLDRPDAEVLGQPGIAGEEELDLAVVEWRRGPAEPAEQVLANTQDVCLQSGDVHRSVPRRLV